jgi:hypothetical protein
MDHRDETKEVLEVGIHGVVEDRPWDECLERIGVRLR